MLGSLCLWKLPPLQGRETQLADHMPLDIYSEFLAYGLED